MPDPIDPQYTLAVSQNAHASAACSADETAPCGVGRPAFGPPVAAGEVGTLGPYRVVRELGRGGMGAVYLALDDRLGRRVALKVMLPESAADRDARERFVREARAAARVAHDHVVTVYEAGERDGVPYIAMQLLRGCPLDEHMKRGRVTVAGAAKIGYEAALGLEAAHELGLVHRDIKPANLWLEAPHGRVKLLDFGLAKPVGGDAELTRSGAVIGTPAYMSPEQARARPVDHRTDLFSLGAVLYRLATGRNPFVGPNPVAVLLALGTEEPAPVRDLNPEVPEPLAALVHQLLSKAPEHRPQTAAEVAARLHAVLELPATAGRAAVSPLSRPVAVPARADAGAEDVFAGLVDDIEGDDTTRLEESDQPPRAGGAPIEPSSSPRPGPC